MRLRRVDPNLVVSCLVPLAKAGVDVTPQELEAHLLAGGSLPAVTNALISAQKAGLDVGFPEVAALDLAGRDVHAAVEGHVTPQVITCPSATDHEAVIAGVCQDGVRVGAKARVTVRTDLSRLVGGAGVDTIAARVGQGVVSSIGRAKSHKEILESPELIAQAILERGLDSGTCFEILSVDVLNVDVMDNVGARLQSARADTDKRIAQAHAEARRAAAVAVHREMQARTVGMESRVVGASARIPLGVAHAFRHAKLGTRTPIRPPINTRARWQLIVP
jgi:uncharacterized protein YqfA (UPF0365 family)